GVLSEKKGPVPRTATDGAAFRLLLGLFLGLAEEKLADQSLEHHRRLRERNAVALGELLFLAARLEADVGLAEQARREDRRRRVLGKVVALVERKRDGRLEAFVVEMDVLHATDENARAPHGTAHLEAADIVEACLHAIHLGGALGAEVAHLHREDQEGCEA